MKNLITTTSLCILLCSGCSPTQQAPVTPEISVYLSEKQPVNQPDADITIPSILIGEELSQIQADNTPVDNGDGTVTYSLKGGELDSILQQIADSL